ncbi:MAG TPA: SPOR domain-containing protein [Phycisphaerales bacterium]|nr:SPOR domain-containing protein [Phycisphaerales bacterium]
MAQGVVRVCAGSLVLVMLVAGGCSSSRPRGDAAGSGQTTTAEARKNFVALYASGSYSDAYEGAVAAAGSEKGPRRDEAALIAGLSSHALNRNSEAVRWLAPLENRNDRQVSGKASATMGLIAQERGEHETAARLLSKAASRLEGDEAARAAMYAGDSFKQLGQSQQAEESYQNARRLVVNDGDLRVMIGDRIAGKAITSRPTTTAGASKGTATTRNSMLTVQIGAFSSMETAQKEAQKVASRANVRIVPILSGGKRLYAVRVGQFSNRDAAETIRKQIGGKAVVTVASGE